MVGFYRYTTPTPAYSLYHKPVTTYQNGVYRPTKERRMMKSHTLFDTKLGICGIVWTESDLSPKVAVVGFQLPEATAQLTEERILDKWESKKAETVPNGIKEILRSVQLHFKGKTQNFQDVRLEFTNIGDFTRSIYETARNISPGRTTTYGQLAEAAGFPGAARAVGQAMRHNPIPLIVPCHRVLASGHKPGGFSAYGGLSTKMKMLELEGANLHNPPVINSIQDIRHAAARLAKADPQLAPFLSHPVSFRATPDSPPYETLIKAVIGQQLAPKAAKTILARIEALDSSGGLPIPNILYAIPDEQFANAGLSRAKTRAIKEIAIQTINRVVPDQEEINGLGDAEIIRRLTPIFGIGRWTVEMLLIFHLGRMDILPADDYALRKSIARVFKLPEIPTPRETRQIGEKWRPFRTVASLFLWQIHNEPANRSE